MERIFTVEEVAEILRVKPFTVRQMFRERRLAGFKVGKAWRITESALKTEIDRLKGHYDAIAPQIADEAAPEVRIPETPAALAPEDPPKGQPSPDEPAGGAGHLLIFSDIPGQEVFLDDVKKGPTTLSLTNVPAGEHNLRIGDKAATVTVLRGVQVRVRRKGEEIAVAVPPEADPGNAAETGEEGELDSYRFRLEIENQAEFVGRFTAFLAAEESGLNARMFGALARRMEPEGLAVSDDITQSGLKTLFDGNIRAKKGERLRVSVSDQLQFDGKGLRLFKIQHGMVVRVLLTRGGLLRSRYVVRLQLAADSQ